MKAKRSPVFDDSRRYGIGVSGVQVVGVVFDVELDRDLARVGYDLLGDEFSRSIGV